MELSLRTYTHIIYNALYNKELKTIKIHCAFRSKDTRLATWKVVDIPASPFEVIKILAKGKYEYISPIPDVNCVYCVVILSLDSANKVFPTHIVL
jgi:hypothetical protein